LGECVPWEAPVWQDLHGPFELGLGLVEPVAVEFSNHWPRRKWRGPGPVSVSAARMYSCSASASRSIRFSARRPGSWQRRLASGSCCAVARWCKRGAN